MTTNSTQPGRKPGRPKGSTGAKSRAVEKLMREHGFNPIEAMIVLVTKGEELFDGEFWPLHIEHRITLLKELAQYFAPKLKAMEIELGAGPLNLAVVSGIEGSPGSAVPDDIDDLGID